ncbi:MAG: hypothetical protein ABWZ82_01640 [Candidatus Limnocylindrales bacterium]
MSFLDSLPIPAIVALFAVVALVCYELGFRLGRWWQDREPGEQEGPTGVIVGGLLGLMAFLLAIAMGMASDRFDTRRALVMEEANAIRAAYLQADYLPPSAGDELKGLLRDYVPLRIATNDRAVVLEAIAEGQVLRDRMWAIEAAAAQSGYAPDLISSLGDTLTEVATVAERREIAALHARVPETVLWLLLLGSWLSLAMLGYSAGLTRRRSLMTAIILILALGAVTSLVVDLDRPQDGFLQVSQFALRDVQAWIEGSGPPP